MGSGGSWQLADAGRGLSRPAGALDDPPEGDMPDGGEVASLGFGGSWQWADAGRGLSRQAGALDDPPEGDMQSSSGAERAMRVQA